MIGDIFNTILYQPLYNGLVFLISVVPFGDVGLAVISLTLIVKFAILPLTHKGTKAQARLKEIAPEVTEVKEQFKDDKQEQSRKMMELYKKHGVNPFSGCFLLLIQLPIIIALYWVFWKGLTNGLDESNLYAFVRIPEEIEMRFLGLIDMSDKSIMLALLAGISQYFQFQFAAPSLGGTEPKEAEKGKKLSLKDEFAKSFRLQMKYGFPVIVFFVSYTISAAVALYWTTSNVFTITHELIVRKRASKLKEGSSEIQD